MAMLLLVLLALLVWPAGSGAADYPERPLRLVVPFPPGGAADILARGLGPNLAAQLGRPVIVDNRPGANGVLGFDLAAKAAPDGYTLLLGFTTGVAVNPLLAAKRSYDPVRDFVGVSMIARTPMVLVAHPAFQASSVEQLIALAKAAPGKLSYGSPGVGNPNHLAGELFKATAGIELTHVPYKGAALVVTDVMGGHVPVAFITLAAALPHVRAGKLKALATTAGKRPAAAAATPTMSEAGVPGVEIVEWFGILAPIKTPRPIVARLNQEIVVAVGSPEVQARFAEQGLEPVSTGLDEFAAVIRADIEKLARIVRQIGIRPE